MLIPSLYAQRAVSSLLFRRWPKVVSQLLHNAHNLGDIMSSTSNKKLYVGSLPYSLSEEELRDLFTQYGDVASVRIITDRFTGQSKGFGFVEMTNADEAQKAVEGVNGTQISGRTLIVNDARPEQRRERSFSGGNRWGDDDGERRERRPRRDY